MPYVKRTGTERLPVNDGPSSYTGFDGQDWFRELAFGEDTSRLQLIIIVALATNSLLVTHLMAANNLQFPRRSDLMGINLGKMVNDAVKGVSGFIDKTGRDITKAIDQNGDGKLDFSDIQTVSDKIQANQADARRKTDLERLKPLFPDDFERAEFVMPKMIRVAEIDKPHADNPVCKGSIGFTTVQDNMSVITIYRDYIIDVPINT